MYKDTELSVYELGVIKNSLRERMITIEEFRLNLIMEHDEDYEKMNSLVYGFRAELVIIEEKVRIMILNKSNEICF